jgi:hypothetical protein
VAVHPARLYFKGTAATKDVAISSWNIGHYAIISRLVIRSAAARWELARAHISELN